MKKILITGVNGFIGSHCYDYFCKKYDVFGLDYNKAIKNNCIQGSVTYETLNCFNTSFDYIIHLAGSGTVGQVTKNPELEFLKTVDSTKELLHFISEKSPFSKIIYSSSAAVYGSNHTVPISEEAEIKPVSLYGEHKLIVENLLSEDCKQNNRKHIIIRFFSIYGEGLKKQVLWDSCNRILDNHNKKEIQCFGTGNEKRDFVHIDDAVRMIEYCIMNVDNNRIFNCGTGISTSISDIIHQLGSLLDYNGKFVFENMIQEGNPEYLIANIKEATKIGFFPKIDIRTGLKRYIEWIKKLKR